VYIFPVTVRVPAIVASPEQVRAVKSPVALNDVQLNVLTVIGVALDNAACFASNNASAAVFVYVVAKSAFSKKDASF
jgi:hypothetical protein